MKKWFWRVSGFFALTLLWCLAVWFALPVDLPSLSPPSLALPHIVPPVSAVATWFIGKRGLAWLAKRRADKAAQGVAQEKLARQEAERTARQAALRQRRASLECREIFLELASVPEWFAAPPVPPGHFMQNTETLRGAGSKAALEPGLRRIFASAFLQSAAIAYLPVYVAGHERQLEWARSAWREAAARRAACFEGDPPAPDCRMLPGTGPLAARVLALFENDPSLPALVLLGMDSPLGDAPKGDDLNPAPAPDGKEGPYPGHAVALVVLSRPGLIAREVGEAELARQLADPNLPFWEHERVRRVADHAAAGSSWGKVPVPLQAAFCALKPFAALHRPDSARWRDGDAPGAQVKRLRAAIAAVSIHAALREPPSDDGEAGKDDKVPETPQDEAPLEVGWLMHNSGGVSDPIAADRLVCVLRALNEQGCELNAAKAAGNLLVEHGDVGAAGGALMLAEALIRAAQSQKPVLMTEFREDAVDIGVARPVPFVQMMYGESFH